MKLLIESVPAHMTLGSASMLIDLLPKSAGRSTQNKVCWVDISANFLDTSQSFAGQVPHSCCLNPRCWWWQHVFWWLHPTFFDGPIPDFLIPRRLNSGDVWCLARRGWPSWAPFLWHQCWLWKSHGEIKEGSLEISNNSANKHEFRMMSDFQLSKWWCSFQYANALNALP